MSKSFKALFSLAIIFLTFVLVSISTKVFASSQSLSYTYPRYNVDININKDSTFIVTEHIQYKLSGLAHKLSRGITTYDPTRDCSNRTCGGFDKIDLISVTDQNGNDLKGQYSSYTSSDQNNIQYFIIDWNAWPNGKYMNNDLVEWNITYKITGGIQSIGGNPYFYWNALPNDTNGGVDESTINISFPDSVNLSQDNLKVYSSYIPDISLSAQKAVLKLTNLYSSSPFTISYKFLPSEIDLPGSITFDRTRVPLASQIYIDGKLSTLDKTSTFSSGLIKDISIGNHTITIKHIGYKDYSKDFEITSGLVFNIDPSLNPTSAMQILLYINIALCLSSILFIPLGFYLVYLYYKRTRINIPTVIIPIFNPPDGVNPYLLGAINDELVKKEQIAGTIIDLAYRGYIKIKEVKKNVNYQLTKLPGKKDDKELDEIERLIIDSIFSKGDVVDTNTLKYSFPYKYNNIVNMINNKLIKDGYFKKLPIFTISLYIFYGITLIIISLVINIFITFVLSYLLGTISIFSPTLSFISFGIGLLFAAKFMPNRTEIGGKVWGEILGFKMYLNTAERYRLQNLGPDEFERYLSYAIVMNIEKKWASNFSGIYNKVPDWYEGSSAGGIYDAFIISSLSRSFINSAMYSMTPIVQSNSSKGGGWSGGGGSFGGFSGGGGGGGFSGAR